MRDCRLIAWRITQDDVEEIDVDFFHAVSKSKELDFVEGDYYMSFDKDLAALRKAFNRFGSSVTVLTGTEKLQTKAFLQDFTKSFRREHGGDVRPKVAGFEVSETVAYFAASAVLPMWEDSTADIIVEFKGDKFLVVADSTIYIADEPCYIWALLRPLTLPDVGYYASDLGGDLDV